MNVCVHACVRACVRVCVCVCVLCCVDVVAGFCLVCDKPTVVRLDSHK